MNLQTIIFIGRSGAGKGMQSGMLQEYLKEKTPDSPILYIETGAYFRNFVKSDGYTWERARVVNEIGGRQPDFLAVWVWGNIFVEKLRGDQHVIFDGTPRSVPEAKMLDTAFPFYERHNPTVIFLNVSQAWAEDRLHGRGRADDLKPEVVAKRLAFFDTDVAPAVEYYRDHVGYKFIEVNGEQTPEKVHADILKQL